MTVATRVDKVEQRRLELAESALRTLGDLGYARTGLREIAANSPFSHGVVHYYFHDKIELITFCVRHYKTICSRRYDDAVASATTSTGLVDEVVAIMSRTLLEDAALHRLWYDLRTQSMFEPALRDDVRDIDQLLQAMVGRIVSRAAELGAGEPLVDEATAYAAVDGLFEQALVAAAGGEDAARQAAAVLGERVGVLLTRLVR
ncbi:TetR/AcrR family transcriptional regulator [Aeromicrobium sp. 50.2.37]|uniref:TetR/AcrR family transcriptional regulator n=1 Tax=Aeromicrobium sp. 50.2.37 TaxID=2969305 RepID=UPI0021503CB2|nr:TetR/AcrR family transcriptional regulator [Aeromicrobium sp. 50.2.37]MCR4514638.1 TetR/AcrR family transcriptional regulator [Aeromicrobium sp. 50.2.37]